MKIIYIAGFERSGTTLIQNVIGERDSAVVVGEFKHVSKHFGRDTKCGCGVRVGQCQFWGDIKKKLSQEKIILKNFSNLGGLFSLFLWIPFGVKISKTIFSKKIRKLELVYAEVARSAGVRIIIDSSKSPIYGFMLSLLSNADFYLLHVVRDYRGIDYSLISRKQQGHPGYKNYSSFAYGLKWGLLNSLITKLSEKATVNAYKKIRYEDFVRNPSESDVAISEWAGIDDQNIALGKGELNFSVHHSIGGSPSRHVKSGVRLVEDAEWKKGKVSIKQRISRKLLSPILSRYGYK